jgi:ATP-binding cassette, subfamily F, member 3
MDALDLHLSPLQYFAKVFVNEKDEKLRSHLSNFGISGPLALQTMYTLSGGQKSRVAFAKVRCQHKEPSELLMHQIWTLPHFQSTFVVALAVCQWQV